MYFTINNTTRDRNQTRFIFEDSPTKLTQREIEVCLGSGQTAEELMADPNLKISQDQIDKASRALEKESSDLGNEDASFLRRDLQRNVRVGRDAVKAEKAKHKPESNQSNGGGIRRYRDIS